MSVALYLVAMSVRLFVGALELAMLARFIVSFLDVGEDSVFVEFIYTLTDIVVEPVAALYDRLGWFEDSPLDMSYFTALIVLSLISKVLTIA